MSQGCVGEQIEGIHDGESFANRWSHPEIEMRHFVGPRVVLGNMGFVLGFGARIDSFDNFN